MFKLNHIRYFANNIITASSNICFSLLRNEKGVTFNLPKLPHSLLITPEDIIALETLKHKIKTFNELRICCDGASQTKVFIKVIIGCRMWYNTKWTE